MANIYFIGSGQMSEAIIRATLSNQVYQPENIQIFDTNKERLTLLQEKYRVIPADTLRSGLENANIIVLGVRPQDDWAHICQILSSNLQNQAIIISLIAGVTIDQLKAYLSEDVPVVRTIPNTLTDTGFGYSGIAINDKDRAVADNSDIINFFNGFGKVEFVQETWLDAFTGFSVAGPNYIYYFYESFVDAGVLAGLPRDLAKKLALENLKGSAAMLELTHKHPRELLDINNSPAGVGMHALYELNNSDFSAGLQRSVLAGVKRTSELGRAS